MKIRRRFAAIEKVKHLVDVQEHDAEKRVKMRLGKIKCPKGSRQSQAFGPGSRFGNGKTAGKGHKGQRARSGARRGNRIGFIGDTLGYFRHVPKIGFSNHNFKVVYRVVNIADIESRGLGGEVGVEALLAPS